MYTPEQAGKRASYLLELVPIRVNRINEILEESPDPVLDETKEILSRLLKESELLAENPEAQKHAEFLLWYVERVPRPSLPQITQEDLCSETISQEERMELLRIYVDQINAPSYTLWSIYLTLNESLLRIIQGLATA